MFLIFLANTSCVVSSVASSVFFVKNKKIKTYTHLQTLVPVSKVFLWRYTYPFLKSFCSFPSVTASYITLQPIISKDLFPFCYCELHNTSTNKIEELPCPLDIIISEPSATQSSHIRHTSAANCNAVSVMIFYAFIGHCICFLAFTERP